MVVVFSVPGLPQPCQYQQTKLGIIYQKPATKTWQRAVGLAAAAAVRELDKGFKYGMYSGPVECSAIFRIQPSKTMAKRHSLMASQPPSAVPYEWLLAESGQSAAAPKAHISSPSEPVHGQVISGQSHLQKPDVTNLWKGAEDGLKHLLWCDDCQVQSVIIQKMWSTNPGAEIRVDLLEYEVNK